MIIEFIWGDRIQHNEIESRYSKVNHNPQYIITHSAQLQLAIYYSCFKEATESLKTINIPNQF